jgi:hypothetical protein
MMPSTSYFMHYFLTCLTLSSADRNVAGGVLFLRFCLPIIYLSVFHMLQHYSRRICVLEMNHLLLADPIQLWLYQVPLHLHQLWLYFS